MELRYELLRLRLIRLTWWLCAATVITGVGMAAAMVAMARDTATTQGFLDAATATVSVALTRGPLAAVASLLLGIVVATRDLHRGASGSTLVLFSGRTRLFSARLAAIALAAAFIALVTVGFSTIALWLVLPDGVHLDIGVLLRTSGMFVLVQAGFATLGACLGILTGSTGVAATIGFGWMLLAEPALRMALGTLGGVSEAVAEHLPVAASTAMLQSLAPGSALAEPVLVAATPLSGALAFLATIGVVTLLSWQSFRARQFA